MASFSRTIVKEFVDMFPGPGIVEMVTLMSKVNMDKR